jgi:hypothetical protein
MTLHNSTTTRLDIEDTMTPLCELAKKHETDKGGGHYRYGGGDSDTCHNYTPVYDALFGPRRDQIKHVLEIGINAGSSLRMWKEYFPNAQIVGIDCREECMKYSEDRILCLLADQNNPLSLCNAMAKLGDERPLFDLIIDDGSHEHDHQSVSLRTLLPFLAPGGYYVVEDLGPHFQMNRLMFDVPEEGPYFFSDVPVHGGLGKANCIEHLFVVGRVPEELREVAPTGYVDGDHVSALTVPK